MNNKTERKCCKSSEKSRRFVRSRQKLRPHNLSETMDVFKLIGGGEDETSSDDDEVEVIEEEEENVGSMGHLAAKAPDTQPNPDPNPNPSHCAFFLSPTLAG